MSQPPIDSARLESIAASVARECRKAMERWPPMHSGHEGYAVIKEELEELWQEIKANNADGDAAIEEATQVAAMGMRYLYDVCSTARIPQRETKEGS